MIATHLIRLGSRVVDKTMVIGETGSPFSPVAYRLLGTQTPDEIFPAIRLPVILFPANRPASNRKKLNGLVVLVRKVSIAPKSRSSGKKYWIIVALSGDSRELVE